MCSAPLADTSSYGKPAPVAVAIVDDDTAVLESLQFLLQISGYRVATFGSAAEFLADGAQDVHYLIIDHHMPQMTGLELIERVVARTPMRRILLITGSRTPAIEARAAALGVAKVLEKPPAEDELLAFLGGSEALPPAGGGLCPPAPPTGVPPASQIGSEPIRDAGGTPS